MATDNINPHPTAWQVEHPTILSNNHNTSDSALSLTAAKGGITLRPLNPVIVDTDMHVSGTLHTSELEIESLQVACVTFGNPAKINALRIRRIESGHLKLERHTALGWNGVSII